jgi:outer membrane protein W
MMNFLKTFLFVALMSATALAQDQMSSLTWNIGIPAGRMASFMDKTSYSGFGFEFRRFLNENTSVGVSFSWSYWSHLTDEIISVNNGAVSGTQIRYYNSFPMFVSAHYYMNERNADFRPYVGLNVGAYYIRQRLEIGIYAFDDDNWHFGLAPEAGFMYQVSNRTYLSAAVRYNYAFDSGTTLAGKDDNSLAYWGVNIGIVWFSGWF